MNTQRLERQLNVTIACLSTDSLPEDFRAAMAAARCIGSHAMRRVEMRIAGLMKQQLRGAKLAYAGRDRSTRLGESQAPRSPAEKREALENRFAMIDYRMPPGEMTAQDVCTALGWGASTTRRTLHELASYGFLIRTDYGRTRKGNAIYTYRRTSERAVKAAE